ncbi:MAG: MmcQ/YjbR family DNA-binding protein [Lachnospiraceae bacterium]|nr:MmcQ/YjbR family DNA-binding protein [Lachnospiraceae bacterium]
MYRQDVLAYVKKEYGTDPVHLWQSSPDHEVLRHEAEQGKGKGKWYALIMSIKKETLGLEGEGFIDVINLKCEPEMIDLLRMSKGYLPAYHMNKNHWITVLLDGTVPFDNIKQLIDESYGLTADKKNKKKHEVMGPKHWIIPANPKYFDLIQAFNESDTLEWTQRSNVQPGDFVYIYVGAPYSALMYKCKAVEVDIPCNFVNEYLTVKRSMRLQMLCKYEPEYMPFERMKSEFGVYAVRGPRYMPESMRQELG